MSVDVEDYFQVSAFDGVVPRSAGTAREPRRARTPNGCSSSSTSTTVRATFFVLGWVAERFPALVRRIAAARPRDRLARLRPPAGLRPDAATSSARTSAAPRRCSRTSAASPVRGYRAPSYSITERSLWALDVLIEEGYAYDASIFPIHHDRYGIPDVAAPCPTCMERAGGALVEVPGSTVRLGRREPADRRRRLLPAPAVRLDALGHRARQPRRAAAGHLLPASVGDRSGPAAHAAGRAQPRFGTIATSDVPKRGCGGCCATSPSARRGCCSHRKMC